MSIAQDRAQRLREKVSILQVLVSYGYGVEAGGEDREQQFCCDLHGGGMETTPSARVYPRTNSTYCFACSKSRDPIRYVMDKEGADFWKAVRLLEKRYNLPWDGPEYESDVPKADPTLQVRQALQARTHQSFAECKTRVAGLLRTCTREREHPMQVLLGWWEYYDRICFGVDREDWPEATGLQRLMELREKALQPRAG